MTLIWRDKWHGIRKEKQTDIWISLASIHPYSFLHVMKIDKSLVMDGELNVILLLPILYFYS